MQNRQDIHTMATAQDITKNIVIMDLIPIVTTDR